MLESQGQDSQDNQAKKTGKKREILVMRLSAIGDVVMTIPVITSLLRSYPDTHITFLSNPKLAPLFAQIEGVTFFAVDTKKEYKGIAGIFKLYRRLRKMEKSGLSGATKFDAMVDLHDVLRSKILRKLMRMSQHPITIIDKGRAEKKALTRRDNKEKKQLETSFERYQDAFSKAGYKFDLLKENYFPEIVIPENSGITSLLSAKDTKKWIGVAPFAQHAGKIYPVEYSEKVVSQMIALYLDTEILLFGGGEKEKTTLDGWAQKYPRVHSCVGRYSMLEELALIHHCEVVLTMDSANMHLASLVGTPVVSIWGATHPYAGFYGYMQKPEDAVQLDMDCRPCSAFGNKPCLWGDYRCMTRIHPEQIVEKLSRYVAD